MRIRLAIPDKHVTPDVLEAALEATTIANEQMIRAGEVPPIEHAISKGLRWRPEPYTDGEHFDLAPVAVKRGWADCDDLAPYLAAEMRAHGVNAIPRVYKSGKDRWHVVVEDEDGRILDPSRWAGMGSRPQGVVGMIAKPFALDGDGALAVVPRGGKFWARCDLPWGEGAAGHIASHARADHPDVALDRAIAGAIECGAAIESPAIDRCMAIGEMLLGEPEHIGSLFGGLKKLGKLAASAAIPGGGAAMSALSALHKGKGKKPPGSHEHPGGGVSAPVHHETGKPSMIYFHPKGDGPVIVRF